ncbi:hypothetical protein G210_3126 [Candida maltosa Xu316]|uniref:Uncharacterized protein n=1 Tax=Candida maltosa (strain Xu316) TaxID=1245528 RepID=M3J3X6_CANMX|nr:hypothetical protein G210_3126 [Candida maltosa Xu316]
MSQKQEKLHLNTDLAIQEEGCESKSNRQIYVILEALHKFRECKSINQTCYETSYFFFRTGYAKHFLSVSAWKHNSICK